MPAMSANTVAEGPAAAAAQDSPTASVPAFAVSAATEAEVPAAAEEGLTAEAPDQRACEGAHTAQQEARVRAADWQTLGSSGRAPAAVSCPDASAVAAAAVTATPQDPTHDNHLESDEVDVETGDPIALPVTWDDVARGAYRPAAQLQNRARAALAAVAGCSRAVPQHAVALLASLRGTGAAVLPDGGDHSDAAEVPCRIARHRMVAACWQHHADQQGCARAVSRAEVASLIGLLSHASRGVERPQVRLRQDVIMLGCCCHARPRAAGARHTGLCRAHMNNCASSSTDYLLC